MALQRRKAVVDTVNFGDTDMYVAGGGLPEGDYCMMELGVEMYQAQNERGELKGPSRLGVMITFQSLTDLDEKERKQFYSMGTSAHKSFTPNPENGKGIVAIPGGLGMTLSNQTNWMYFLKSLTDCGLPKGIFTNDISVLEGTWVHISNVPEPEERKGFASSAQTGEAAAEIRRPGTIAVVSEIKEDGKPWEEGGGIPGGSPPKASTRSTGVTASRTAALSRAKAAPQPAPDELAGDEAILESAKSGASVVLAKSPKGCAKLILKTGVFKAVNDADGTEMAQAVIDSYFTTDDDLSGLLGEIGFSLSDSGRIVPGD